MNHFLKQWSEAAYTSAGFFWMALWAFVLGYAISGMIQIFITQKRMKDTMGGEGAQEHITGYLFWFCVQFL